MLSVRLSEVVTEHVYELIHALVDEHAAAADRAAQKENEGLVHELYKLASSLQSTSRKKNVVEACRDLLYGGPEFERSLDENPLLLGFENGVYDLSAAEFRAGKPEDMLTLSVGYNFVDLRPDELEDCPEFLAVRGLVANAQPVPEVCAYLWLTCASLLEGGNAEGLFHVWTGSGGNCKSVMLRLLHDMLGNYAENMNVEFLTQKRPPSSAAQADLLLLRCKRLVEFTEPEEEDEIRVGHMKRITGGDTLTGRPLFSNDFQRFPATFVPILAVNKLPALPPESPKGRALRRRIRLLHWNVEFHDDASTTYDENNPNHKKAMGGGRPAIEAVCRAGAPFLTTWLLRVWYPRYKAEGLCPPDSVALDSDRYIQAQDPVVKWKEEEFPDMLENTGDSKDYVQPKAVWECFGYWYDTNYRQQKKRKPKRASFLESMVDPMGKPTIVDAKTRMLGYKGWRWRPVSC